MSAAHLQESGVSPTAGCLFSGMGGFASGLQKAEFSIKWASDHDPFACATFRHRFPGVRVLEKDVRELSICADRLPSIDLLAAGFPCQSFSQAGSRRGFDDPRGSLFFEIPRLLQEYCADTRPKLVVLENVPYLLYGQDGGWFEQVRRSLRKSGYWFRRESCWIVNVKDATSIPQDRERLFMVAASRDHFSYNPFSPPVRSQLAGKPICNISEFIERNSAQDDDYYLPPTNRYFKMISQAMEQGESIENLYQLRRSYVREKKNGLCPTLTANMGVGGHNVPFIRDKRGIRRLRVGEVARLQGFAGDEVLFPAIPQKERYRLLGNSVCVGLSHLIGRECRSILNGV